MMIKELDGMLETVKYEMNSPFLFHHNFEKENYPKHWHSAVEVIMPIQNTYEVVINEKSYHLEEYDIIIIPPGDIHEIFAPATLGQRIYLQFDLALLKSVFCFANYSYVLIKPWHITPMDYSERLHKKLKNSLLDMFDEYLNKSIYFEDYIVSKIISFVIELSRNHHNVEEYNNADNLVKRKEHVAKFNACIEYINNHYKENLTLDMVSRAIGFSKYHFARWFKQFANVSFYDYVTRVRVHIAESILLNSETPITEIAMEAGFQSITTFNRIFKEHKKCTPSEFKKYQFSLAKNKSILPKICDDEDLNDTDNSTFQVSNPAPADLSLPVQDEADKQHNASAHTSVYNPSLYADVPYPDVIRVGNVYYMTSTTIHFSPGCPVMKSYDLVNWEIINYVYDILDDSDALTFRNDENSYGKGSWASSLRYNNGTFYVAFASYNTGKTYIFQTEDIENGRWIRNVIDGIFHDMSLLFDDDGRVYMVYGCGKISVLELTSDAASILPGGLNKVIIENTNAGSGGGLNAEGSHIYKINGRYYIFLIAWPQRGSSRRIELCCRADYIDGQYESIVVFDNDLHFYNADASQGAIVDTPDGDWYAVVVQYKGSVGRIPVLVPFIWKDGWPEFAVCQNAPENMNAQAKVYNSKNIVISDEFYQGNIYKNFSSVNDTGYKYSNKADCSINVCDSKNNDIELIENGDFSNGAESWSFINIANISAVKDEHTNGAYNLFVSGRITTSSGPMQIITGKVLLGHIYKVYAKVKYISGPETKCFNICIRNGPNWEGIHIMGSGTITRGEWGSIEGTYTLPLDADTSETIVFIETPWEYKPVKDSDLMDYYVSKFSLTAKSVSKANTTLDGENDNNGSNLSLSWQWNHNPDNNNWSLLQRPGYLRLITGDISYSLTDARNTLTQRAFGPKCSGTVAIDVSNMKSGDIAGLAALQEHYGFVGVKMVNHSKHIIMVNAETKQAQEIQCVPLLQNVVYLKVDFDFSNAIDRAYFYYSLNGIQWYKIGNTLNMVYSLTHFAGYRFALFNYATQLIGGYADFDYFRVENNLTENNDDYVILNVSMGDSVEVLGVHNTLLEIPIIMDALPKGDYKGIFVSVHIPYYLDVTDVIFCNDNIKGNSLYTYINKRLQLFVLGENISFFNKLSDMLAVVKLRVNGYVPCDTTVTVKPDYIYVDGGNVIYNIHDIQLSITLKHIDMKALCKVPGYSNPLISHKFGADPYALIFGGRLYIYLTSDAYEYDNRGKIINNTCNKITTITVISSVDMLNWTDHGEIPVAGPNGIAKWAAHSWAPAVAHKVIDGKDKFFLYFANDMTDIGVLTSNSPIGPWTDPIGKSIINREVPGAENVTWCFDPAVLIDDDGTGYLYFGGGLPNDSQEAVLHPKTARVIRLGNDMISTAGKAELIDAPAFLQDSGIHKYNQKYYYTYCSNFSGNHTEGYPAYGEIAYMIGDSPMGPFKYRGSILKKPDQFFDVGGYNHHCVFMFNNQWYIAYHAQTLGKAYGKVKGYRSPHINKLELFEDGYIMPVKADMAGVSLLSTINPYERVEAETIAWRFGISTEICTDADNPIGFNNMQVTDIHNGDWLAVANLDFGANGPSEFIANVASSIGGEIEIRIDSLMGQLIGILGVGSTGGENIREIKSCSVSKVTGVHNIFFMFKGDSIKNLFNFDYWMFIEL